MRLSEVLVIWLALSEVRNWLCARDRRTLNRSVGSFLSSCGWLRS